MNYNYLIESNDYIIIKTYIDKIIKENNFQSAAYSEYNLEEVELSEAIKDLDTYSLFCTKKVIIIKNIEKITNEKELNSLIKYLENPSSDNLLIVCSKKLNNVLKTTKLLKKHLKEIKTDSNSYQFIKNQLNGYNIGKTAINLLIEYCQNDITKLKNECDKLKNYKIENKEINSKDIEELCIKKIADTSNITFSFVRNLAEKNIKESLLDYQKLIDLNIEPLNIIGLLASQFRIMYQVKSLEEKHLNNIEIANTLKEKPFRISKTKELTKFYKKEEIRNIMIKLEDIDLKLKTTNLNSESLIELFILNINKK